MKEVINIEKALFTIIMVKIDSGKKHSTKFAAYGMIKFDEGRIFKVKLFQCIQTVSAETGWSFNEIV